MQGSDNRARRLAEQRAANARRAQPHGAPRLPVPPQVPYHPSASMRLAPGMRPVPGLALPVAPTLEQLNRLQLEEAIRASLAPPNMVNLTHLDVPAKDAGPVSGGGGPVSGGANAAFSRLEGSRIEYIERQESLYCGKHALNNLLGGDYFTTSSGAAPYSREDILRIGSTLSPRNKLDLNRFCKLLAQTPGLIEDPGREPCPDNGDFASNLLVLSIRISGFQAGYINIEKQYAAFKSDNTDNLLGYIVNYGGGHWVCLIYNRSSNNYIYKDSVGPVSKSYATIAEYIGERSNILQILRVSNRSDQDSSFLKGMRNARNEGAANRAKSNQIKLLGLVDANGILDKAHKDIIKTVVIPFSRLEHQELIEISILDPDLINRLNVSDIVNTEIYLFLIKLHGDSKNYFNEILNSIRQLHTLHGSIPIDNIIDAYAFNFFDAAKTDRYLNDHPELSRPTWVDPISHYYSSEVGRKLIANGKRAIGILRKHLDINRKNDLKAFTAMVLAGPVYGSGGPARGNGGGGGPVNGPVDGTANKPPTKLVKSCPVCTFDNDAAAMVCSQCGTSLADVVPGPPQAGGKRRKITRFTTKRRSKKGKTQKRLKRH
jgi:hypothetical protein